MNVSPTDRQSITLVDVVHNERGYMLEATTKADGARVGRATRRLDCNPRAHGSSGRGVIKTGDCFVYLRGEGRQCVPCAISIGSLEPVDAPRPPAAGGV